MEGWIKLWRKLGDTKLWLSEPFTRGQAWVDLLMLANHADGYLRKRGLRVEVKRGQVGWSEQKLAERWQWSRGKVRRFLSELASEKEQKTVQQKSNITNLNSIINYEEYQGSGTTDGHQTVQQTDTRRYSNKNGKNKENEKKEAFKNNGLYARVIDHLNERTGKSYRATASKTQKLIKARLDEGFEEKDFIKAIDNQVRVWLHDQKYSVYLRPETLFSPKFDGYVNNVQSDESRELGEYGRKSKESFKGWEPPV